MNSLPALGHVAFGAVVPLRGRGKSSLFGGQVTAQQLLPTDAVGSMTLTLQNIAVTSAWRLEVLSTGATVATGTAPGGDIAQAVSVYQPNQVLLLKVRKGTASPYYRPFETQVTVTSANASIFVSQIPDE